MAAGGALRQRLQQRLGLLEISGIKSLGEPVVDWCQKVMGFLAFALLLPQASQAGRRSQLEGLGLLGSGALKGVVEAALQLRRYGRKTVAKEFALETAQLWFVRPFSRGLSQSVLL